MTTITAATSPLATAAASAAQSAAASAAANSASGTATGSALSSLTSNFNTFLTLLTTQLQNQDPTSPMDSDTFTSELAQFAGVEQQVQTNTNLGQLITLGQTSSVSTSQSLIGDQVSVSGSEIALQNGASTLQFSVPSAEPVAIAITNSAGQVVRTAQLGAAVGNSSWTWDGTSDSGAKLADGTYTAAIESASGTQNTSGAGGTTATPITFTSTGTVTGITRAGDGSVQAELGAATIPLADLQATSGTATAAAAAS